MTTIQYLSDYVAIRQLNAVYNRLADVGDGPGHAALFTTDCEFHLVGHRTYLGREGVAAATSATKVTVHITIEPEIVIHRDSATQRVRFITAYRATDGSRNEFVATGNYVDELKRTPEGWRYHRRRVELDLDIAKVYEKMTITEAVLSISRDFTAG